MNSLSLLLSNKLYIFLVFNIFKVCMTWLDGNTLVKMCVTEEDFNHFKNVLDEGYLNSCSPINGKCNNEYYSKYLSAEAKEG